MASTVHQYTADTAAAAQGVARSSSREMPHQHVDNADSRGVQHKEVGSAGGGVRRLHTSTDWDAVWRRQTPTSRPHVVGAVQVKSS
jgi:hypothetical protein